MIVEEEVYLEHFGVKGMKWGVRKERNSNSSSAGQKIKRGAAYTATALAIGGTLSVLVVRNKNLKKAAANQKAIRDTLSVAFRAKDARGNILSEIGSAVTSETIRALRR